MIGCKIFWIEALWLWIKWIDCFLVICRIRPSRKGGVDNIKARSQWSDHLVPFFLKQHITCDLHPLTLRSQSWNYTVRWCLMSQWARNTRAITSSSQASLSLLFIIMKMKIWICCVTQDLKTTCFRNSSFGDVVYWRRLYGVLCFDISKEPGFSLMNMYSCCPCSLKKWQQESSLCWYVVLR